MIYAHIWNDDVLDAVDSVIKEVPRSGGVPKYKRLPHVIMPDYVGTQVAREVVESYYCHARHSFRAWVAGTSMSTERLLCEDFFGVGLRPANVLGLFKLSLLMDEFKSSDNR